MEDFPDPRCNRLSERAALAIGKQVTARRTSAAAILRRKSSNFEEYQRRERTKTPYERRLKTGGSRGKKVLPRIEIGGVVGALYAHLCPYGQPLSGGRPSAFRG
jgi:hypothetical protein